MYLPGKMRAMDPQPTDEARRGPGAPLQNQNAVGDAMGGEGGLRAIERGQELTGLAAQAQREVETELETDGRAAIVKRAAIRLESVARLFYNAILSAADRGDLKALAGYSQRYAWLQSRALGAWKQLKAEATESDGDGDAIIAKYRGKDAGTNS